MGQQPLFQSTHTIKSIHSILCINPSANAISLLALLSFFLLFSLICFTAGMKKLFLSHRHRTRTTSIEHNTTTPTVLVSPCEPLVFYWNRPLGAVDGRFRLTCHDKNNKKITTTNKTHCWAIPIPTLARLLQEVKSMSCNQLTTLEVIIQSDQLSESDWCIICRQLTHQQHRLHTVVFVECTDLFRAVLLQHTKQLHSVQLQSCRRWDDSTESQTSWYAHTFAVLASRYGCQTHNSNNACLSQSTSFRELIIVNGPMIQDTEAIPLMEILPQLDRLILQNTTFANVKTWWHFFEWAENHSLTAITWEEPHCSYINDVATVANTDQGNHYNKNDYNNDTFARTQLYNQSYQKEFQDYLNWNCKLNLVRQQWLHYFETLRRIQQPQHHRIHHKNPKMSNTYGAIDISCQMIEAACTVLRDWYRSTHRPLIHSDPLNPRRGSHCDNDHNHHQDSTTNIRIGGMVYNGDKC